MRVSATRTAVANDAARAPGDRPLFDAIGRFLNEHRLGFGPAHYAFAHRLLSDPHSPFAQTVAALTDGGVRLTERDVATLGGTAASPPGSDDALARAHALVAQTRTQMADFTGLIDRMRAETTGFGRDLAASVDAIGPGVPPAIVDLTAAMLARVETAETRLADVTSEAAGLRAELEEARTDARADPLTGLANRRALSEAFAAHIARGAPGCLAICDIDHFKQVNDRFGHAVGDRVLSAIARTLADGCEGALVARYGGEEFAVLFDHGDLAAATTLLDEARATVAGKHYRLRENDAKLGAITFSGGVIVTAGDEDFYAALGRADALLYQAKSEGRNRIAA